MTGMLSKYPRLWAYSVLLATGSVLLFLGGPDYYSSRVFKHAWDIGHIVYFALLASLLLRWRFVSKKSLPAQWAIIFVITLLIGASIEFMQYDTQRTPDTGDVLRDLTGSLLVLVLCSSRAAARPVNWLLIPQFILPVALLVELWPLSRSLIDEAIAWRQFPLLSGFETPFETDRWAGNAKRSVESIPSISQGRLLKLLLTTAQYSGVALKDFDGDWSSFHTLKISLYNPAAPPLQITCRIHDLQHTDGLDEYVDRFNRRFLLEQGWNQIEIDLDEVAESPDGRRMDMSRIRGLGIYAASLPESRVLYLDNVRLSR